MSFSEVRFYARVGATCAPNDYARACLGHASRPVQARWRMPSFRLRDAMKYSDRANPISDASGRTLECQATLRKTPTMSGSSLIASCLRRRAQGGAPKRRQATLRMEGVVASGCVSFAYKRPTRALDETAGSHQELQQKHAALLSQKAGWRLVRGRSWTGEANLRHHIASLLLVVASDYGSATRKSAP